MAEQNRSLLSLIVLTALGARSLSDLWHQPDRGNVHAYLLVREDSQNGQLKINGHRSDTWLLISAESRRDSNWVSKLFLRDQQDFGRVSAVLLGCALLLGCVPGSCANCLVQREVLGGMMTQRSHYISSTLHM